MKRWALDLSSLMDGLIGFCDRVRDMFCLPVQSDLWCGRAFSCHDEGSVLLKEVRIEMDLLHEDVWLGTRHDLEFWTMFC